MTIKNLLPGVKKNILLKNYTTFKIGGPAKYFFVAKNKEDLIKAISVVKKLNPSPFPKGDRVKLPFFILGGGSNLLVSDKGFNGLVIKMQNPPKESFRLPTGQAKSKTIYVEAGVTLGQSVSIATKNNLTGLEWAAGIPGTVGGAVYGNAGAFGKSMKDVVKEVEVFDVKTEKIKIFKNKNCKFNYRESIFKKNPHLIILSTIVQLKRGKKKEIENKIKKNLEQRNKTQPLDFPSAGSVFKNPRGFSAGNLIKKCGLKGKKVGNVKISEIHSNFIVNLGKGKAKDAIKLIKLIKKEVKKKFKVNLEEEIQYLP